MNTSLYVGNLSYDTTEIGLEDLFKQYGKVQSVNIIMDKHSGRSRGFAFVAMATPEEAKKAIEALDGYQLDGRNIVVNEAQPKEKKFGSDKRRRN